MRQTELSHANLNALIDRNVTQRPDGTWETSSEWVLHEALVASKEPPPQVNVRKIEASRDLAITCVVGVPLRVDDRLEINIAMELGADGDVVGRIRRQRQDRIRITPTPTSMLIGM